MGQQQLLLIVLGVIVVGIAIVVGINLFQSNAVDQNRAMVIADLHHMGYLAQSYYKRPTGFGGGNNSFVGFTIPAEVVSNQNGTYSIATAGTATSVVIQGVGKEIGDDGSTPVKYQFTALSTTAQFTLTKLN
jgi:hypothetical protein